MIDERNPLRYNDSTTLYQLTREEQTQLANYTLIHHTAKVLKSVFDTDKIFRIGGDEFVVILTGMDYENYLTALIRLDEACLQEHIVVDKGRVPLSLAKGIALFDCHTDSVYEDVFDKADQAMYINKKEMKAARVG